MKDEFYAILFSYSWKPMANRIFKNNSNVFAKKHIKMWTIPFDCPFHSQNVSRSSWNFCLSWKLEGREVVRWLGWIWGNCWFWKLEGFLNQKSVSGGNYLIIWKSHLKIYWDVGHFHLIVNQINKSYCCHSNHTKNVKQFTTRKAFKRVFASTNVFCMYSI